jgi:Na+/H+ antiporter NhaC
MALGGRRRIVITKKQEREPLLSHNYRSRYLSARNAGGSAMGDFLTGASWGAWFILAGIAAAGLWAFVH